MKTSNQRLLIFPMLLLACLPVGHGAGLPAQAQGSPSQEDVQPSVSPLPSSTDPLGTPLPVATNSNFTNFIWLHLLEIAGLMALLLWAIASGRKNSKLLARLATLESITKEQKIGLQTVSIDMEKIRKSTDRIPSLEQQLRASSRQQYVDDVPVSIAPAIIEPPARPEAPVTAYPFLNLYQQSHDAFKGQYSPIAVSEDSENIQRRWAGEQQEIILGEDRQGNYWLVQEHNTIYLVPSPKLKVNDMNMRTVGGLFTCENYNPGYRSITVGKPAIVSAQSGMGNQRWKLEQKGVLEFI